MIRFVFPKNETSKQDGSGSDRDVQGSEKTMPVVQQHSTKTVTAEMEKKRQT